MATDIDISHYNTGTATVAANGTAVTGQGTTWQGAVRAGDMFGTHKGDGTRILSVNSNTSLTLAYPWTGGAQTAAAYEIQRTPYDLGYQKAVEDFLEALQSGNLPTFAALAGSANKLPYFDGPNSMALADFPAWARALFAETGQLPNARIRNDLTPDKAFRRGNILGTVSRSGSVPTGAVIERGENANGEYVRLADGTQICWKRIEIPAIDNVWGSIFNSGLHSIGSPAASFVGSPMMGMASTRSSGASAWVYSNRNSVGLARGDSSSSDGNSVDVIYAGRWF